MAESGVVAKRAAEDAAGAAAKKERKPIRVWCDGWCVCGRCDLSRTAKMHIIAAATT